MRLYTADFAPNPRRVHWVMAAKGISDIELIKLDMMALEHRNNAGVKASGAMALPVLELDDGSVIAESVAIGRYLESLWPEPNMFGEDALEIARIEMWTRRIEQYLATPLMLGTRLSHRAMAVLEAPNPEASAYFLQAATTYLETLNVHLEGRAFIAADRLSIADIAAVCALDFARIIRYRPDTSLEHVNRWLAEMRARPDKPAN